MGGGTPGSAGDKKGKKRDAQSGTVYVLDGGELRPVSVQLGITDNRNTEVVGGDLHAGDRVVDVEAVAAVPLCPRGRRGESSRPPMRVDASTPRRDSRRRPERRGRTSPIALLLAGVAR